MTANFVLYGTEPVRYRRIGDQVQICGAIKPATSTIATSISGAASSVVNIANLATAGIAPSQYYALHQQFHGSGTDKWLMVGNGTDYMMCQRYSGTATTSTWMTFSVNYML